MMIDRYLKTRGPQKCACCGKLLDVDRDMAQMAGWDFSDWTSDWTCPACVQSFSKTAKPAEPDGGE